MQRHTFIALTIVALLGGPALAAGGLERPDPGIGEGFANAMAESFMKDHGLSREEADCLVYEVVQEARRIGHTKSADVLAAELLHLCKA